jgi:small subunit ribosomal protein S4
MKENSCKICRRFGQKLFLKGERCSSPKCAMIKRSYPPGQKKKRRTRSMSEYNKELREKQKLRNWYNLKEHQFKKYIQGVLAKRGKTLNLSLELIKKLEKRLDNVIFRMNLAKSRKEARQLISHGYFLVNGKEINIPSFEVKKGDIISLRESKKEKNIFKDFLASSQKIQIPSWVQFNVKKMEGKIIAEPSLEEALPPAEILSVFEFYSK